jgi:hypothetical protein
VASVGVALTLCGHSLAGGGSPDLLAVTVALLVSVAVSTVLLRRERNPVTVVGVLVALQAVTHLVLASAHGAHGMRGIAHGVVTVSGAADLGATGSIHGPPLCTMLIGHGLAALAMAWVLTRGERALRAVVSLLWRPRPRPAGLLPTPSLVPSLEVVSAWLSAWLVADERRRGPPVPTCAA